ncbi:hypothetical protein D1816_08800 [Aquimarina sp. AD10]|uniref:Uncharacterized protein n=1 Tax=Aquimarina aggregata TaxID=1642818 RepID=A0A162X8S5_9FLAO|nr:hypothetical protein D1816_08800 [Aquimarina sp. AD10]KZS38491.1 hypothetical protein AWE51_18260 [Aquimarina aggregata]RKM96930.1 hypothetical protein D7033_14525 [Aquimarina sp. AD10]
MIISSQLNYAQTKNFCLSVDETGIIEKAYKSFENDLFTYYKFGNDSIKTYRTFLAEVASLSLDLRKLPSTNSIQLAREFKKIANNKNSLWIKLSEYENQEATKKSGPSTSGKNQEEVLIFNYRGGFIQCLKNTSDSDDFKDIVNTLEEDGNVSTSLISQRIYYIPDKEFCAIEIKNFIAFDVYYSILMVIEKAFG